MTTTQIRLGDLSSGGASSAHRPPLGWAVHDSLAVTKRNLISLTRQPQLIVFSTIQPVIFVLMFTYVFGGAIRVPGVDYVDYLMPGIFCQTVVFGAINTGIGLSDDLQKGLVERFRSLPMARSAVLAGRTSADLVRDVFVVLLMLIVGYAVGFRVQTNLLGLVAGIAVLLLFAFSMTWIFAVVGLKAPSPETAQAMSFPILAPLVFASSAFVSTSTMPGWLQVFANHQPVTAAVNATRGLMLGGPTAGHVWESLAWSVAILAVFAPLAIRSYRKAA
jgi:ABC-2 type transport system permease protein/oleandomycin transport system permease protein